jgi:DNA-binding FadR family transcriptional regulator
MMTRAANTALRPAATPGAGLSVFERVTAPRSLTHELISWITADITSGRLEPGSRLPTEQALIAATGVSRTVVREAVAALRADGLVVTRQGVGAFVAENVRRPFRIEFDELRTLREVLEVMELRTGIEIEAAGLAAERATPAQLRRIAECFEAIGSAVRRGDSAVDQDYAFHCSIAEATGNAQFKKLLEYLGRFMFPRHTIKGGLGVPPDRAYLEKVQLEHRQIIAAIRHGAVLQARAAMRRHLLNSRKRYQKLAGGAAGGVRRVGKGA